MHIIHICNIEVTQHLKKEIPLKRSPSTPLDSHPTQKRPGTIGPFSRGKETRTTWESKDDWMARGPGSKMIQGYANLLPYHVLLYRYIRMYMNKV